MASSSSSSSSSSRAMSCSCSCRLLVILLGLLFTSTYVSTVNATATATATATDTDEQQQPSSTTTTTTTTATLDVVTSIENDLEFDENNKLKTHYIVFPANRPDCSTGVWESMETEPGYGIEAHPLEGEALAKVFSDYDSHDEDDNRCMAACLEKGTDIKVAGHTMPYLHYESSGRTGMEEKSRFTKWFHLSCSRVEVCFINYAVKERPLQIYWINKKYNSKDNKKVQMELGYSERKTTCFHAFLGHEFEAIDEESGFYEKFTVEHATSYAFGTSPPSSTQRFGRQKDLEKIVKRTLKTEWSKHKMVERTFSSLGFAKGKLPDDVFANMGAFYYNNRNNVVNEEWEGKGIFVNWWETDVKFVTIPWTMKVRWQLRLSELVSAWAGVDVEQTSMYGFRQYEAGARLLSHVDRMPTHAVSLIVNIAQDNLAAPWPIEVFDHADRLHEITMEAGEIVYYESAKNLHSRNRPLTCKEGEDGRGCHFINLFTHYRPIGDNDGDQWHSNMSDMPNRPPPLLEGQVDYDNDISACKFDGNGGNDSNDDSFNILGVGTVKCNDERLGQYISPTLYKLKSADDLFNWWKASTDPNFTGFDEDFTGFDDDDDDDKDDDNNKDGTTTSGNGEL